MKRVSAVLPSPSAALDLPGLVLAPGSCPEQNFSSQDAARDGPGVRFWASTISSCCRGSSTAATWKHRWRRPSSCCPAAARVAQLGASLAAESSQPAPRAIKSCDPLRLSASSTRAASGPPETNRNWRHVSPQELNDDSQRSTGRRALFDARGARALDGHAHVGPAFARRLRLRLGAAILGTALCSLNAGPSFAREVPESVDHDDLAVPAISNAPEVKTPETWNAHGQFTFVAQSHKRFNSPYAGENSLYPGSSTKETADLTVFLGARLWPGGEFYLNPEIDQGFGLSNTVGVAGFPSGEAYKVGQSKPYFRLNRAFVRNVVDLGGEEERLDAGPNVLGGTRTKNNLIITVGKFSVVDVFDNNIYAHDSRADFLNWSVIDAGAFDYAADAWGYTYGAALEWTQGRWTLRAGTFALSKVPNSEVLDRSFRQYSLVGELEARHELLGHAGKVKVLAFVNRGRMARYEDAIRLGQAAGTVPEVASARRFASRPGVALNVEQEIATDAGLFARASVNDGSKEAFEFTEINRSLSAGASLSGNTWHRPGDTAGLAFAVNALSGAAQRYFAAGGIGILIGDGRLPRYGSEQIFEAYYSVRLIGTVKTTLNFQRIVHPAYNRDRGPVSIFGLRAHAEF